MKTQNIAEILFLLLLAGVGCGVYVLFLNLVVPNLYEVRLDAVGLRFVLFRVIPVRTIPYADIESAYPTTRRELLFKRQADEASISGMINRRKPLVAIRRRGKRSIFVFSPRNREAFLQELHQRMAQHREEDTPVHR
jgi:hypothetical protein